MERSVNSVAPGKMGAGVWSNNRFFKYFVFVVQVGEGLETTADAALSFIFSVDERVGRNT